MDLRTRAKLLEIVSGTPTPQACVRWGGVAWDWAAVCPLGRSCVGLGTDPDRCYSSRSLARQCPDMYMHSAIQPCEGNWWGNRRQGRGCGNREGVGGKLDGTHCS